MQKAKKLEKQNWKKKDKILADLDTMKHKMRQLKGQYELNQVSSCLILNSLFPLDTRCLTELYMYTYSVTKVT